MTQLDLVKRALAEIGTRTSITSMTDGSPEANYATLLYAPLRDFLLREGDYDWAMVGQDAVSAGGDPTPPWKFIYVYPTGTLRVRQVIALNPIEYDPRPVAWSVSSVIPSVGAQSRFIFTQQAASKLLLTVPVVEDLWDSIFQEAFVRMLSSALAFALENRIEASREKLSDAISFAGIANLRDS